MVLPEVNVLLALAFEAHQHHPVAKRWFAEAEECVLCRMTQSAFLRLASNSALFGEEALTLSDAWSCYDALSLDERFTFAPEPLGLEHMWRRLTMISAFSPKVWNDRYLAAFALTSGAQLVTFDRGFAAVAELSVRVLDG